MLFDCAEVVGQLKSPTHNIEKWIAANLMWLHPCLGCWYVCMLHVGLLSIVVDWRCKSHTDRSGGEFAQSLSVFCCWEVENWASRCWLRFRRDCLTMLLCLLLNPLMGTLKPQGSRQLYSNTVIDTLAVDGWTVTLVQRGGAWVSCGPTQSPPRCTQRNSPPSTASVPTS